MSHPEWFVAGTSVMIVTLVITLDRYQRFRSVAAYADMVFWGRVEMVLGIAGLLGTAPPL
jgi:hypothetical protein